MAFELPPLPYAKNALEPHMSAQTLDFHHGKHHQAYVTNLNKLVEGKPEAAKSLEDIILSSEGPVFNNAAQIWNHTFYWSSMKPNGAGQPAGDLGDAIKLGIGDHSRYYTTIGFGMWLGAIMWFNVWFIIWPNQQKVMGLVQASDDEKKAAARTAGLTSRVNTLLSIPMVYCMVGAMHFYA